MEQDMQTADGKRVVYPPVACTAGASPILSVVLNEDEDVKWYWTHFPGGESIVTGYEIVKRDETPSGFDFKQAVADWLWGKQRIGFTAGWERRRKAMNPDERELL